MTRPSNENPPAPESRLPVPPPPLDGRRMSEHMHVLRNIERYEPFTGLRAVAWAVETIENDKRNLRQAQARIEELAGQLAQATEFRQRIAKHASAGEHLVATLIAQGWIPPEDAALHGRQLDEVSHKPAVQSPTSEGGA